MAVPITSVIRDGTRPGIAGAVQNTASLAAGSSVASQWGR